MKEPMQTTTCQRCGKLCRVGAPDPEARPFRKALVGFCLECCVAHLFQVPTPDNQALPSAYQMAVANGFRPEHLLLPHLQQQFRRMLEAGLSQAKFEDIDWPGLIEKWDLPFAEATKKRGPKGQGSLLN